MTRSVVRLCLEELKTPLGGLLLATDGDGTLRAADFADCEDRLRRLLERRLRPAGYEIAAGRAPVEIRRALAAYFDGDLNAVRQIPLLLDGTAFQEMVWTALRAIEAGKPVTYGELACALGQPRSGRAVGHANAANPVSIVVPCHRLVGAAGALTGYSGGLQRKRWLLDHEARHAVATRTAKRAVAGERR